jgi:hypothetical protein
MPLALRRGELVRLRPLKEIEAALDAEGRTDMLPFMAEMLTLQGKDLGVASRADKTCDTINMLGCNRKMTNTVHLNGARCDGSRHGGCQAACLLFFKEEWLERAPGSPAPQGADSAEERQETQERLSNRLHAFANVGPDIYRCQATQMLEATSPLLGNSHYVDDLRTRNVPLSRFAKAMFFAAVNRYQTFSEWHFPRWMRFHDGYRLPDMRGPVRDQQWPVVPPQNLQPGDLVEVRSREEIQSTLDEKQRNRGLWFDEEMTALFGKRGRVICRVERLIDEKTGRMLKIKKDLYLVSGMVSCEGVYHKLCTRAFMAMMRDAWLRRID